MYSLLWLIEQDILCTILEVAEKCKDFSKRLKDFQDNYKDCWIIEGFSV